MSGNKNHFAKFVKLKTENVSLASKLNQVTKSIKSAEVAGIKTISIKDKGNKFALDFTGLPPPVTHDNDETGRNSINTNRTLNSVNTNRNDPPPLTARSLVRHQIEQYRKQQIIEKEQKQLIQEYIRESQPSPSRYHNDYDDMRLDVTPRRHEYEQMISEIVNSRLKGGTSPVDVSMPASMIEQYDSSINNDQNLGLPRQLSSDILKTKENNDDFNVYSYSVGKPRPPSTTKKFDNQRVTTPTSSLLNGRVIV